MYKSLVFPRCLFEISLVKWPFLHWQLMFWIFSFAKENERSPRYNDLPQFWLHSKVVSHAAKTEANHCYNVSWASFIFSCKRENPKHINCQCRKGHYTKLISNRNRGKTKDLYMDFFKPQIFYKTLMAWFNCS